MMMAEDSPPPTTSSMSSAPNSHHQQQQPESSEPQQAPPQQQQQHQQQQQEKIRPSRYRRPSSLPPRRGRSVSLSNRRNRHGHHSYDTDASSHYASSFSAFHHHSRPYYYQYDISHLQLNDSLNTQYVYSPPDHNDNIIAVSPSNILSPPPTLVRSVVDTAVKPFWTPRQILIAAKLTKALTICFLILTGIADVMYIVFVSTKTSSLVHQKVGGTRDLIIRLYGVILVLMALGLEMVGPTTTTTSTISNRKGIDIQSIPCSSCCGCSTNTCPLPAMSWPFSSSSSSSCRRVNIMFASIHESFSGLLGFIPRSLLLFFIATITNAHPLHDTYQTTTNNNNNNNNNVNNNNYQDEDAYYSDQQVTEEIPDSTIVFQMVTSTFLGICATLYFIMGCFCLDRFRPKAFLSNRNPLEATAIPSHHHHHHSRHHYHNHHYTATGGMYTPNRTNGVPSAPKQGQGNDRHDDYVRMPS